MNTNSNDIAGSHSGILQPHKSASGASSDTGSSTASDDCPRAGSEALSVAEHCARRRETLANEEDPSRGLWGLALSGGGIRSATFCFGLLKALATNDLLRRMDILSTVSGGGFTGSTVGRLFQEPDATAEKVQEAIAQAETRPFGAWLRSNGRYLIPRGAKDLMFAAANFGRNLLGIHVEIAFLCLLLGGALVGLDLLVWEWADCIFRSGSCWRPAFLSGEALALFSGFPPVWLLLPLVAWAGTALAYAYWALPAGKQRRWGARPIATALMAIAGIVLLLRHSTSALQFLPLLTGTLKLPLPLVVTAIALLLAWLVGIAVAAGLSWWEEDYDLLRNRLTASLSIVLMAGFAIAGIGVLDYLAWSLGNLDIAKQGAFGVALALAAVALRAALPKIADLPKSLTPGTRSGVMGLISIAGFLLMIAIATFWISWVHRVTSDLLFVKSPPGLRFDPAWDALFWITIPPFLLVAVSWRNRDFLNRSSLFNFYRARLTRGYLGAGNPNRFGNQASVPASMTKTWIGSPKWRVSEMDPGDDVPMGTYAPHLRGGPVHLINVCVNQTRDPRGGLFNQDRKGLLLTVGPNGQMCTKPGEWRYPADEARMTLGSWMAISGAAVAPGLGASTRSGVAAILMMAGLRLGYWWDSLNFGRRPDENQAAAVGKYGQFFSELRGRFDGDQDRDWFLSDGGHFENTAAYSLLREECEVIVLADCGADPRYSFGDLENLVRKARIDLQADITFLRPKSTKEIVDEGGGAGSLGGLVGSFGSLNDLASADSQACLALARIDYRHSGATGHMIIVKPNMCHGVPVDLVNFKADNPLFPQEPTTDQFFSEAQWESYFQLGQTLGTNIKPVHLSNLPAFAGMHFVDDDGALLVTETDGKQSIQYSLKRISSRIASTGAVSASISLGAITTIGFASWDAIYKEVNSMTNAARIEPATYKELTDIFGKLSPISPGNTAPESRVGEMATTLLRVGDAVCNSRNLSAFRQSQLMLLMIERTKQACRSSPVRHASCDALLDDDNVSACLQSKPRVFCEPAYWIRDYADPTKVANCWDPSAVASSVELASTSLPPPTGADPTGIGMKNGDPGTDPATPPAPQESQLACKGKTIYLQIYGPELRDYVRQLREPWRSLGASVPPVEDVWDSARRAGRRLPQPYPAPTVIFHSDASKTCAEQLQPIGAQPAWQVIPLPSALSGRTDVIEVWVPPTAAAAEQAPAKAFCYQEDDRLPGPKRYGVHCHTTLKACTDARGENKRTTQTECRETSLAGADDIAFSRGWARSWYAIKATPFDKPFPQFMPVTSSQSSIQ